jgi:integrase
MGTVISFYRWLIKNNYLNPTYPTWEEKEFHLSFTSMYGKRLSKTVRSTDLRIQVPKAENDFDGTIQDGGKLTPLTEKEQDWLIEAAEEKGNTECLLIQLFMLGTGARIESACTLRLSQFTKQIPTYSKSLNGDSQVCRLKAGPGTGIETKNNKNGTFQIPRLLYELLQVYACSKRAQLRRNRYITKNGEHSDIYLFLTQQGSPYYRAKTESRQFDANFKQRHAKNGQPIRQFIAEHAIPYVRDKYELSFFYRPHDLRASYGMNVNEELMKLVENGKISLHKARLTLKELLWHSSLSTTDLYLNYTKNRNAFSAAVDGFGQNLQRWANKAKCGLDIDE